MKLKRKELVPFFEKHFNMEIKEIFEYLHLEKKLFRKELLGVFNSILSKEGYENMVGEKWLCNWMKNSGVERLPFDRETQIKDALKQRWSNPEQRELLAEKMRTKWKDEEYQKSMKSQTVKLWENGIYNKNGEKISVHWKNPEYRKKVIAGVTKRNLEDWKSEEYREKKSEEFSKRAKKAYEKNPKEYIKRLKVPSRNTKIELFVKDVLENLEIAYESQKMLKLGEVLCIPDFVVNNKIIEVNGDYFHVNPIKDYKNLSKIQLDTLKRDEKKYKAYSEFNLELLVIWEFDIKKTPEKVIEEIKKYLEE